MDGTTKSELERLARRIIDRIDDEQAVHLSSVMDEISRSRGWHEPMKAEAVHIDPGVSPLERWQAYLALRDGIASS